LNINGLFLEKATNNKEKDEPRGTKESAGNQQYPFEFWISRARWSKVSVFNVADLKPF
jgi:hypothetical protein